VNSPGKQCMTRKVKNSKNMMAHTHDHNANSHPTHCLQSAFSVLSSPDYDSEASERGGTANVVPGTRARIARFTKFHWRPYLDLLAPEVLDWCCGAFSPSADEAWPAPLSALSVPRNGFRLRGVDRETTCLHWSGTLTLSFGL
jgi:hypothetical protein